MTVEWNKTTPYSRIATIVVFFGVFCLGFYVGMQYGQAIYGLFIAELKLILSGF